MNKNFALESRILRLERLFTKNEFLDFNKLTSDEEKEFIDKLFIKYSSLSDALHLSNMKSKSDDEFNIILSTNNGSPYNGMYFKISTKGGRKNVYVTAYTGKNTSGSNLNILGSIKNLNLDTDINKIAEFILSTLVNNSSESYYSNRRVQNKLIKNENVPLTSFDCKFIKQAIEDYLDDLPEVDVVISDDNSDYGSVKVSLYNPKYLTDYEIIVSDSNSIKLIHKNKTVDTAGSIDDAAELLSKDFMKDYIDGKYRV